jgi:DNA-binding GntR family transcriptional regulator
MLAVENLVTPLPRAGYLVTQLTVSDVQESFHLRALLECEAARLAATRITEVQLAHLDEVEIGTPPHVEETNRDFHLTIAKASGSQRLFNLIEQMLDEVRRTLTYDPYMIDPPRTYEGHREIIEALRKREPEAAAAMMHQHIANAKLRVLQKF